jgi:hypothetical protein
MDVPCPEARRPQLAEKTLMKRPQTDGQLLLETTQGNRESQLRAGQSYAGLKGVEHNVVNVTGHEVVFIEVEIR